MVTRASSVNHCPLVDCLVDYDFKTKLPCARMFTCINNVSWCCQKNRTQNLRKPSDLAIFENKKLADSQRLGRLVLYMPKPDKNNAFKCQKCSNFFHSDCGMISDLRLGWKKVRSPPITRRFPGEPGASEQQPKRGTLLITSVWFWIKSWADLVVGINSYAARMG